MSRRDIRRMLMGERKPLWERRGVLAGAMAAVLVVGLGLGVVIGKWYRPAPAPAPAVAEKAAERAEPPQSPRMPPRSTDDEDAAAPLLNAPPPPRPGADEAEPADRLQSAAVPLILPQPSVKPTAPDAPAWIRYAVPAPKPAGQPMIAVIIDDLGVDRKRSERVTTLRAPLTLAYMTYAEDVAHQTAQARARGHELMVHVPMQPMDEAYDPGPDVLEVNLKPDELQRRLQWGLSRFDGFIGINNHMGSRFTADRPGMRVVMEELRKRGLAFVDSVTTDKSVAPELASRYGVPFAARQIFLDNEQDVAAVKAQLTKVEAYARKHGYAVAIGHPHDATVEALAQWLPGLDARGFVLVPVSAIIKLNATGG
ncbi:MAG: divergent polysaccharide deacetylase family protein [Actinomycetota bacterium]